MLSLNLGNSIVFKVYLFVNKILNMQRNKIKWKKISIKYVKYFISVFKINEIKPLRIKNKLCVENLIIFRFKKTIYLFTDIKHVLMFEDTSPVYMEILSFY